MGLQCSGGEAVAWGFWLTGSVARLVLTLLILVSNNVLMSDRDQ